MFYPKINCKCFGIFFYFQSCLPFRFHLGSSTSDLGFGLHILPTFKKERWFGKLRVSSGLKFLMLLMNMPAKALSWKINILFYSILFANLLKYEHYKNAKRDYNKNSSQDQDKLLVKRRNDNHSLFFLFLSSSV